MNKVILFESNINIMELLKIAFQGNSNYSVIGECHNKESVIDFLGLNPPDTLLMSHTGAIDLAFITLIHDLSPNIRVIGIRLDKDFLSQTFFSSNAVQKNALSEERTFEDVLEKFTTIQFKETVGDYYQASEHINISKVSG